ncbi:hypothetical protein CALVIDRAFT_299857 [Calocera viscosa TUFC12733]|uniref:BZIP domain-containing protein n=1 Tax=Calocera viscosa (strain TUFC12733) TaxID=1330018 RepID=A0A167IHA6_CALVF|nr:hypothetical protein CALVIDRAFT_299857 [Calocera viscosa TUFC12733]
MAWGFGDLWLTQAQISRLRRCRLDPLGCFGSHIPVLTYMKAPRAAVPRLRSVLLDHHPPPPRAAVSPHSDSPYTPQSAISLTRLITPPHTSTSTHWMSQYANTFYDYSTRFNNSTAQWGQTGIGLTALAAVGAQQQQQISPTSADEQSPTTVLPGNNANVKTELASLFGSYADMRAGHDVAQTGEMTLDDIFDLSFLSDSESTGVVDGAGTISSQGMSPCASGSSSEDSMTHLGDFWLPYIPGVTDSSALASQLQSYLAQFYGTGQTLESPEQPVTITPDEIWRGSTPTFVPPTAFDLPVPSPTNNELAAGGNYSSGANHPVQQSAESTGNPIPTGTPTTNDSAPGPPADDYSASPSVDIEIKTEPDLESEEGQDGRPIRAMPTRAAKSRRRIPLDAPIQPRNYNGPSRTAAKPLPKGFEKVLPAAQATSVKRKLEAEDEEEEDDEDDEETLELVKNIKDKVALKRAKNTLAARKSRARKAAYTDELERSIAEREIHIADLERQIRERDVEIRLLKELRYPDGM